MNNPLVSVVLSVYNGEKYLGEAIESILNQTYKNFEFIIVNDGSADRSLKIIKSYDDERIVLISRKNRGLIASLNEGIKKAKGKYIARMDADDISLPQRFIEQVSYMEEHKDIGVCGSWIEVFGENFNNKIWKLKTGNDVLKLMLLFAVPFAHPSVMIRKRILDEHKIIYDKIFLHAEDYKFWVDLSYYTNFANIPKVLFRYRYVETSISRLADKSGTKTREITLAKIFNILLEELKIKNINKENKLHYILMKNERIQDNNYVLSDFNQYIKKLIECNNLNAVYNKKKFNLMMGKKYLSVIFLKKELNFLKFNFVLLSYGVYAYLQEKLK